MKRATAVGCAAVATMLLTFGCGWTSTPTGPSLSSPAASISVTGPASTPSEVSPFDGTYSGSGTGTTTDFGGSTSPQNFLLTATGDITYPIPLSGTASASGAVTTPASAPTINLAGTWSGTITDLTRNPSGTVSPCDPRVTWLATQNGSNLAGALTLTFFTPGPCGPGTTPVNGTMTGTLSRTRLSLNMTIPNQSPMPAGCLFTGTGNTSSAAAAAIRAAITVDMNLTFTAPCLPDVNDSATETSRLRLTR